MCGLAGMVDFSGVPAGERVDILHQMTRTLVHRGPDDEGFFVDDCVALGHRRLSIIDLRTGHQPIGNEDGSVWVACNGEIYNHGDLRDLLTKKGHSFTTRTDCESIVHAYEEWGTGCLEHLRGMFAFTLWDRRHQRLLLARDRIGKKPLYYAQVGSTLIFASELKALLTFPEFDRALDLEALSDYLSLLYVPRQKTIFRHARKLLPGHYLLADRSGVRLCSYWDLQFAAAPIAEATAVERLREILHEAVAVIPVRRVR